MDTTGYGATLKQLAAVEQLGGTIPKATRDDLAAIEALLASVNRFGASLRVDPAAAVLAALEAGEDPLDDPTVARTIACTVMKGHMGSISALAEARKKAFVATNSERLLDALRGVFDKAAATIHAAVDVLGDTDLDDHVSVARLGTAAGTAWANVKLAEDTITKVLSVWRSLAATSRALGTFHSNATELAMADIPPGEYVDAGMFADGTVKTAMRPFDIARRGWTLRLATPEEWRERIAEVREARQQPLPA